jgi:hypothetical protein
MMSLLLSGLLRGLFLSLLATGAVKAADLPYNDGDFSCIDPARADRYARDFSVDVASFGGMELCDSKVDTKKLFNDLQILEDGKFSGTANNKLIRGFVDINNYYSWMQSQTRSIQRGNDVPYATAYNSWGNFTMQDGWSQLSTLGRVGTVVHEARHTAGYRHFPCDHGSYQGSNLPGCDQSYDQAGSHAIEMEYYARVSTLGANYHPVYKSMARLMAVARANFVFNTPILQKREALVAVDGGASKALLYDNSKWFERELPHATGTLKRTSAGAVLFDGGKAFAIEMYGQTGTRPDIRDDYSYFKLLTHGGSFKDFEEFDIGPHRYVAAVDAQDKIAFYSFPEGKWGSSENTNLKVARTATLLENGDQGFFLVSDQGDIVPMDPSNQQLGAPKNFKWSQSLTAVAQADGKLLSLHSDGHIYENISGQWQPWAAAQGQKFVDMVNVPLYDAFEVAP